MVQCLAEPKDEIFVKGCGFLFFAKNISESMGKNKCKVKI